MKPPVSLFEKNSMKLCFKSQKVKQKIINTAVCCQHKRKDAKENVEKKIGESFLK